MSHHSQQPPNDELRRMFGLGPTGQFPEGKLSEHDEGEIKIAVGHDKGKVIIDFGAKVTWLGFTPDQAEDIADALLKHANAVRAGE